jgi:hypothetical protein
MSLENQVATPVEAVEVVSSETAISKEVAVDLLAKADLLKNAKVAIQLNSEYKEFVSEGESERGVFAGIVPVRFKDQQNPGQYKDEEAVRWLGADKKMYLCASVALVNEIKKNHLQVGAGIEIIYTGKDGNVKTFNVNLLSI